MKCPGQDSRYWQPEAIFEVQCPRCGHEVEFFRDDSSRACGHCGHRFPNPRIDFGCASYCPYAEQCLGSLPPELVAKNEAQLKERLAREVKYRLGSDFQRIGRLARMACYAEEIAKGEEANLGVVLAAVYLLELVPEAERNAGVGWSDAATAVLQDLGAGEQLMREVRGVLQRYGEVGAEPILEVKILREAHFIASLEAHRKGGSLDGAALRTAIEGKLMTKSGKELAKRVSHGLFVPEEMPRQSVRSLNHLK